MMQQIKSLIYTFEDNKFNALKVRTSSGLFFDENKKRLEFFEYIKIDRDKSTFKSHRDFSSEKEISFKHF